MKNLHGQNSILPNRRGLVLILSAPSGVGKTTLSKMLIDRDRHIKPSISMTTRSPRGKEQNGVHYYFISKENFEHKIRNQEFLEHAKIFDHYYGTQRSYVLDQINQGQDVLLSIDWQGTEQLDCTLQSDLVKIFLLPPSFAELKRRIHGRAEDTAAQIHKRLEQAKEEVAQWSKYDYVVINDKLDVALKQIETILNAERLKRVRQVGLADFVNTIKQSV